MKILVFGNMLVEKDNLVLKLLPRLRESFPETEFKEMDGVEDLHKEGKELIILDAVDVLKGVKVFEFCSLEDFDKVEVGGSCSMHDFDLGYNLKLLKKVGLIDSARVVGVGGGAGFEEIAGAIQSLG